MGKAETSQRAKIMNTTPTPDYGEPWTIQEGHLSTSLLDGKGDYFADIHELVGEDSSVAWAKAERIVACVNACAKMADPAAEIAAMREALSGRTVSCGQCNDYAYKLVGFEAEVAGLRAENEEMREAIREAITALFRHDIEDVHLESGEELTMTVTEEDQKSLRSALAKLQPFTTP
jgi:hypothetical protein